MAKPMLAYLPYMQFFNSDGLVLSSGRIYIYLPGTTTLLTTYPTQADAIAGTNANPNPISLDSAGRPSNSGNPIDVYVTQSYKLVVQKRVDASTYSTIRTVDNIVTLGQLITTSAKASNYTVTANDRDKVIVGDSTGGSRTFTLLSAITAGDGFKISFKKMDSSSNTITIQANGAETIDGDSTFILSSPYDYVGLYSDGTQWIKESFKSFDDGISLGSGASITADGFVLGQLFYTETTVTYLTLASGSSVTVIDSSAAKRFKLRNIFLSTTGTNFSGGGGDRNLSITDNTTTFSTIDATALQDVTSDWGDILVSARTTASVAGTDIVMKYSGGTVDYTAGSATVVCQWEKTA